MPLPPSVRLRAVIDAIDPAKDIDGIHPLNAGLLRLGYEGFLPATAHAAIEILHRYDIPIEGRDAVVVGRSNVVGMPAAFMLVREHATVTVCHSRTRDLAAHVGRAEILIVAAGRPGLITGAMLRPGVVVVDVGINVVGDAIVGDVDFDSASHVAGAITPVPGGVGPVTNALLLTHLVRAAVRQHGRSSSLGVDPHERPVRPRDRPLGHAPPDRRRGRRPRPARGRDRAVRTGQGQGQPRRRSSGSRRPTRAASTSWSPRSRRPRSARARRRPRSGWPRASTGSASGRRSRSASRRSDPSSGSRAAPPVAATARSSRWRTSTST